MKHGITAIAAFALAACLKASGQPVAAPRMALAAIATPPLPQGVEVLFSADGTDLCGRVAELIGNAKHEVLVAQYALTDLRVLQALSLAVQPPRNVGVEVLLDRRPGIRPYTTPQFLRSQGIPVFAAKRGLAGVGWFNQRYIVIDRETVILMSCDLTGTAPRNAENVTIIASPAVAARYFNDFVAESNRADQVP